MSMVRALVVLMVLATGGNVYAALIKSGDVVGISVAGYPQFSGEYSVSAGGTIAYPLLAGETIVNISTAELVNHLTFRLARHIDNPLVTAIIITRPEITVTFLGQVAKPGPVTTYLGATIQEALAAAGGASELADLTRIKIVGAEGRGGQSRMFDLKAFLETGDMDAIPRLRPDDTVVLLSRERASGVKVIGGVRNPGFFNPEEPVNLFELIYLAGGPAEKGDLSRVRRFFRRDGTTIEEIIDLQSYLDKGEMDRVPMIDDGDVVIVYTRWFNWQTMMVILNNALLFLVTIQALTGMFR